MTGDAIRVAIRNFDKSLRTKQGERDNWKLSDWNESNVVYEKRERQLEAERLEREQRRLREKREKELREKREREKREYLRKKQEEAARTAKLTAMKEALQRDFDAESAQKSNKTKKEPEQNKNVYEKWMKLDTMEIVRDIGDRVKLCSAAGQDIVDNVQNIEKELKQSLKDHYDTVEPQIEKYKKYGQEMRDMNRLFVVEFDKVLDGKATDSVKSASESAQKQINTKIDHGQKIQDILESNIGFQAKMNAFKQIQNEFDSKKQKFVQQIGDKMDDLQDAVLSMEAKLNIMSTYYDDMISDHDKFINFVITQGQNYGNEIQNIREYLMKIGDDIKGKKRDLYDGQAEDVERKTFSADYDVYTEHTTDKVQGGSSMDPAVAMGIGMVAGAVIGGGIAAAASCGVGTVYGMAVGGAVGGMIAGAIIHKHCIDDEYENNVLHQTNSDCDIDWY
eukprot:723004_1